MTQTSQPTDAFFGSGSTRSASLRFHSEDGMQKSTANDSCCVADPEEACCVRPARQQRIYTRSGNGFFGSRRAGFYVNNQGFS